ncbi:MAG: beta-N-acetylhexosaminidase [Clostridia bacterium]|nr:beta-N-acetylhexosaminidase [Clostridia bacterium]
MTNEFRKLGVMLDCSRNAVMSVSSLKRFIALLARMGYNQVHLYMEDTYEVNGEERFGYLRGRYTKEELKALDDYAYGLGVELVPNIQTLAHMSAFVRWRKDLVDTDEILLVGEEKVYDLIERMFASLRECFRTENVHIGMDEAHMLGRGKYYDLHGPQDRFDILLSHLQRVCALAEKYRFKPMMWSDMFYRIANGGSYYNASSEFDPSIKEKIPQELTLVYWDYYSHDPNRYKQMIRGHRQLSEKLVFAGGAWKWSGFAPNNYFSVPATRTAFTACRGEGIRDVFLTMWGDNGAECSAFSLLPTLCYGACIARGITKMAQIREKFEEWVGARYDDFLLLDAPNRIEPVEKVINPAKYFLYADPFMSQFLNLEKEEYARTYASLARRLSLAAKRAGEYSYLFENLAALCRVLELKQNICTRTRRAYESKDKEQLDAVLADYKKMIRRTEAFHRAFRAQWYKDNKPHGFDVQDHRIGGLLQRMRSCKERLEDLVAGKIDSIPELEEEILPLAEGLINFNSWSRTHTVGRV